MEPKDNPATTSADYNAMQADWEKIADIREGLSAVRAKGALYLPRYEKESLASHALRLETAPWRPEFVDALREICAKPFTKAVTLQGEVPERLKEFAEDVDGRGN